MPLQLFSFPFNAMASQCAVRVYAPDAATARLWSDAAIAEVRRIEAKYSRYRDDSITAAINGSAGAAPVRVDAETAGLLTFGATLHTASDGRFDLTSGVLRRAWDFKAQRVPAQSDVDALLPLICWDQVEWSADDAGGWLRLPRAGMQLDFGGIGKEYAADRAGAVLLDAGARHGLVNLGGDVRVIGPAADGTPWRVAIQDPRGATGATLARMDVESGAVATSGDYERYFEVDGRRYCHLLDARTGWPVDQWQSVSVVAPLAIAAGGCASVAMLLPARQALDFLRAQGLRYLAITASGERHAQ